MYFWIAAATAATMVYLGGVIGTRIAGNHFFGTYGYGMWDELGSAVGSLFWPITWIAWGIMFGFQAADKVKIERTKPLRKELRSGIELGLYRD